jgi:hypothetical protein
MNAAIPADPQDAWHSDEHRKPHEHNNHLALLGCPILIASNAREQVTWTYNPFTGEVKSEQDHMSGNATQYKRAPRLE